MMRDDADVNDQMKVIAAEGEHKASRALRHAAEVIADSPAALQVTRRIMVAMMVVMMMIAWGCYRGPSIFIINTRPKPAYGRQGLAGS